MYDAYYGRLEAYASTTTEADKEETMGFENLTPEQQEKIKSARTREELEAIAAEDGLELSDEELDGIAGGEQPWVCIRDWSCATQTIKPGPPIV